MALLAKKGTIPLFFLLLFVSALILLTLHPTTTSNSQGPASFNHLPQDINPTAPKFTLVIKVLTFNRLSSLARCLYSLSNAHYDNSTKVHLHIYIDHFQQTPQDEKGPPDLDAKLNLSRQILGFVDRFKWDIGEKLVHYRTLNVGLQSQWLEAWFPTSDHEFAFVVEDDLEVSPMYFKFLKSLILQYYYDRANFNPMIYGASLQRPRFVPGKHGNKIQLDGRTQIFLYQLVGTWGQLLFPRPWKEFRFWYDTHKAKGLKPFLDGMVTTGWYKKLGERIWTPWFIKFIHERGYFNLYTNFMNERALCVSHRDAGVNYGKSVGPDSFLVDKTFYNDNLLELHPLSNLKWYNFCFKEVIPNQIIRSSDGLESNLRVIQKSNTIMLVNLQKASEPIVRNLLCHFERLGTGNYIFVGRTSDLLLDLARRGHPVIDVDQFYNSMNIQHSSKEAIKEILVIANVIKKSLELKYNFWMVDSNIVPLSSNLLLDFPDPSVNFHFGKNSECLYIKYSSASLKIWAAADFVHEVVAMADSFSFKDSVSLGNRYVQVVERLLEKYRVKYDRTGDWLFGLGSDSNQTSLGNGKKFVSWPSDLDLQVIGQKLVQLGLWAVDNEFSCTAVVCHSS